MIRMLIAFLSVVVWTAVAGAATVSVAPTAGPPTTKVTVTGGGYGASKPVDVYFDTDDKCLAITNGTGNFSCTVVVPADAQPQIHYVSAIDRGTLTSAQTIYQVRTDWTQFHGRTAAHNGRNPYENTITPANVGDLDVLWVRSLDSRTFGSAIVYGSNVYVNTVGGQLAAFNTQTGATVAGFPKVLGGTTSYSTPAIAGGNIYVARTNPPALLAFNALTGAAVANFPIALPSNPASGVTVTGGKAYVITGNTDNKLHAFNVSTGAPVPGFPKQLSSAGTSEPSGAPAVANGIVYVVDQGAPSIAYAFDANDGTIISASNVVDHANGSVVVSGGTVYFVTGSGSGTGSLFAFSEGLVTTVSGFPFPVISRTTPAVGRGLVVIGTDNDTTLRAYRSGTSSVAWSTTLDGPVFGSPVIAGDVVYANTSLWVYAVSATTGAILYKSAITPTFFSSPTVANGILFIPGQTANLKGKLYALSVNGQAPASRLRGGAMGVRPAISDLKPNYALVPATH